MADNIKLVTYAGSTVTPLDDALIHETAIVKSGIIYGAEVTMKSSNVLHIAAGHGLVCGRKFTITESDISVQLTSGATFLGRLYVHMDLSNTTEPIQLLIETATTLTKVVQQSNVNIINGIYEFNLATFEIDASTISNVVNVAPKVSGQNTDEMKELFVQKTDILKSMEEVTANKAENMVVGPEAVAELNQNMGGCVLSQEGNDFFITGADSVRKKLGSQVIDLGTGTSFNVKSYDGYQNFTVDNFLIKTFSGSSIKAGTSQAPGEGEQGEGSVSLTKSYNASTGKLTCYLTLTAVTRSSLKYTLDGSPVSTNIPVQVYLVVQ